MDGVGELAVARIDRVLAAHSELHELWQENEADYPSWRQGSQTSSRGPAADPSEPGFDWPGDATKTYG
jgi:hypothetical protein